MLAGFDSRLGHHYKRVNCIEFDLNFVADAIETTPFGKRQMVIGEAEACERSVVFGSKQ